MIESIDITEPAAKSGKPLCIANISPPILNVIKSKESISFIEVGDIIVQHCQNEVKDEKRERTLRRRVYDVINVMSAAGVIEKNGKFLHYRPEGYLNECQSNEEEHNSRIQEKEKLLLSKIRQLVFHTLLIEKNQMRPKPTNAVSLPFMLVGFIDISSGSVSRSLDGKQLSVYSKSIPYFFSHVDVFKKMGFTLSDQQRHVRAIPIIAQMEKEIVNDILNES